jgi:hypothetical protein
VKAMVSLGNTGEITSSTGGSRGAGVRGLENLPFAISIISYSKELIIHNCLPYYITNFKKSKN